MDLISVVMPCYNSEEFIKEAVDSVLGQTYPNIELIVVDDGSTDSSSQILSSYGDRIMVLHQANKGPMKARNAGIQAARGEYIAFLDSDDYWRQDCLELLHAAVTEGAGAVIAYCGWQNLYSDRDDGPLFVPPDYEAEGKVERFLTSCPWPIHAALTKRDAILGAGGFSTMYSACEDYDLWLRIGGLKKIVRVPEVLAFYRHHSSSQVSARRFDAAASMLQIKLDFLTANPEIAEGLNRQRLRMFLSQPFMAEGYKCYWNRDLNSARPIFRYGMRMGWWKFADLKYILPCYLPVNIQKALLK